MSDAQNEVFQVWVYLQTSPLLWLTATLAAYQIGILIHILCKRNTLVNPLAIAIILLVLLLMATGTPYKQYFEGAQFVHFLLGPATVALAVPLYHNRDRVRRAIIPMSLALLCGSITAAGSSVAIAYIMGANPASVLSLAPKSVTTPIAMAVAQNIGGVASLTAAFVIITGIVGSVFGAQALRLFRIRDPMMQGFSLGLAAHGLGTARAFQMHPVAGTFAGIAMGLNGLFTAIWLPIVVSLWPW